MSRHNDYGSRDRSRSRGRDSYGRGGGGGGGGGGGRGGNGRVSLLCRNISYDTRDEDVRHMFGKYGDVKDVYLPLDYHSKQPQGYCFIEFYDEKDAEYAKRKLDGERLNGRQIAVVWAKQQRKRPDEMKDIEKRRRSRSRSPRRRSRSRSRDRRRSPSVRRSSSRSPRRRSPSRSPRRSRSPMDRSPVKGNGKASRSKSPRKPSPSRSPRRSLSPAALKKEEAGDEF